jgi:hypothetical protein
VGFSVKVLTTNPTFHGPDAVFGPSHIPSTMAHFSIGLAKTETETETEKEIKKVIQNNDFNLSINSLCFKLMSV